jgi:hypothetical protein
MELSTSTPTIVEVEGRGYESHVYHIDTMSLTVHEAHGMHVVLHQISEYPSSVNGMLIYKSEVKELEINDVIRLLHDEPETSYVLTTNQAFVTKGTTKDFPVFVLASPKKNMILDVVDSGPKNIYSPVTVLDSCLSPNLMLGAVHEDAHHVAELPPNLMLGAVHAAVASDFGHQLQNHLPPKMCIFLHDVNTLTLMNSNRVLEFVGSASNALNNARLEMLQFGYKYQRTDLDVIMHAENNDIIVRHKFLKEHGTSIRYESPDSEVLHTDGVFGHCGCKSFSLHKSNTTAALLQRRDQRGHDSKNASSKRNLCKHILAIIVLHFYSDEELISFLDEDVTTCRGSAAKKLRT